METVILAFEGEKIKYRLRDVIENSGVAACLLCSSTGEVKRLVYEVGVSTVICGYKLGAESAELLYADLPSGTSMVVIAVQALLDLIEEEGIIKLPAPAKQADLINTLQNILDLPLEKIRRPVHRNETERIWIEQAKKVLQTVYGMSEADAHHYLQKKSMDGGIPMGQVAKQIADGGEVYIQR